MKLSKLQKRVIKLMQEGWELGMMWSQVGHTRIVYSAVLQKHGLGCGSPLEDVNVRTVYSLRKRELIKQIIQGSSQMRQYILTEDGKKVK